MPATPPRCRHLHTDGRQCGSPALRGHLLCFQHDPLRRPMPVHHVDGRQVPQLPAPDDFLAIARGIGDILRLLAHDELTDRRAATLLRGYALASQNLARHHRHERRQQAENPSQPVTDCVHHAELGTLALPETTPSALEEGVIPIQQNQDLSPLDEVFETPTSVILSEGEAAVEGPAVPPGTPARAVPSPEPAPHPHPRFTPLAQDTSLQDELAVGAMYLKLDEDFRDKRRAFIHEKTAELEAQFQARLETELTTRLQALQQEAALEQHVQPQPALFLAPQLELQPTAA